MSHSDQESMASSTRFILLPEGRTPYRRVKRRRWRAARRALSRTFIRALNVAVALLGILLTLPVMLLVAVAVRVGSRGPILFRQPRVGQDRRRGRVLLATHDRRRRDLGGRVFTVYKFRTMEHREDRDERWAQPQDPRITPVGRFLRAHHLDELPQLFNVLKGDMNIVGPRPEQPGLFRTIRRQVRTFGRRQRVRPGITGLAQVRLPYARSVEDARSKLELDLEYIRQRSFWTDLSIMARTVPKMLGADTLGASRVAGGEPSNGHGASSADGAPPVNGGSPHRGNGAGAPARHRPDRPRNGTGGEPGRPAPTTRGLPRVDTPLMPGPGA